MKILFVALLIVLAGIAGFAIGRVNRGTIEFTTAIHGDTSVVWVDGDTAWASDGIITMSGDGSIMYNNAPLDSSDQEVVKSFGRPWRSYAATCVTDKYVITFTQGHESKIEVLQDGIHVSVSPAVEAFLTRKLQR